ncbi:MT-A70 family methyltransferase [Proteiniborus sp. MB09-C3]|uniref:MT-A70 family methyltransferase n=1 Tax=Proteiniborus sp. MB09-C3 TaxID=3050072 RepID=UPI00255692D2|nr:MT-A70 family methyltransferase [Proteiniborus sp. MB09-C3]WIV11166.1 MT-A70 family methyltransferase [Proteiniborus sp. MB09-C3]
MPPFPSKKYHVIYADPPWKYGSKKYQDNGRDFDKLEDNHYQTMTLEEFKKLPVQDIAERDCICFMWVTDSHLKEGIKLLEAWGFKYKTIGFNWIKKYESGETCVNFAPWTLKSWELCLIGVKGSMGKYKIANNVKGLLKEIRTKHSKKPEEARKRIEKLFGNISKIELFAREKVEGWDCWGNEVNN